MYPDPGSTNSKPSCDQKRFKIELFCQFHAWVSSKLSKLTSRQVTRPPLRLFRESLGSGGHASVILGMLGEDSVPVAVKILPVLDSNTSTELGAFGKLGGSHRNIVEVYPHVLSPHHSHVHLPMELCDETLLEYAERHGGLEEDDAKWIFRDVASGLLFLRKHGVHHLDVKPDNILMKNGVPKLADLGMAAMALEDKQARKLAIQEKKPYYGTTRYASPECVAAKERSERKLRTLEGKDGGGTAGPDEGAVRSS